MSDTHHKPENRFAQPFSQLPEELRIFPLSGSILLPRIDLPLNIFEPRYLDMVLDALGDTRMIGIIQPQPGVENEPVPVCKTGCAGRITSFSETGDGRLLIVLTGVCRFTIDHEIETDTAYRRVRPEWGPFSHDLDADDMSALNRDDLMSAVEKLLGKGVATLDWNAVNRVPDDQLVDLLAMHLPFDATEKQALVESPDQNRRAELLMGLCEMRGRSPGEQSTQTH